MAVCATNRLCCAGFATHLAMDSRMDLLKNKYGWALLAGSGCLFGFAPFGIYPIPVLALAILFALWQRADTPRGAAHLGFAFGLGLFGAGISWIYVALHDYGDMTMLLALPATTLFCAFLALFTALSGYVQARIPASNALRMVLVMPAVWVSVEWLRGMIFTGFPWLTLGYAHSDSPLAGYAPILGVYGVSLVAAISAGLLAYIAINLLRAPIAALHSARPGATPKDMARPPRFVRLAPGLPATVSRGVRSALLTLALLWLGGAGLHAVAWTQPHGEPFTVALVQGNIAENLKFNEDAVVGTLETYRRLVSQSAARLTVLPETALPLLRHEVPENYVQRLRDHVKQNGGDVMIGVFERSNGNDYNSVFTLGVDEEQHYRKQHLVPFGEFIPLRPMLGWFINEVLDIPMGDLTSGDRLQAPLDIIGQHVAVNICYEDAFGEEIIRALPQATLLVNVTNDAWYGHSQAAAQHNQISRMRALETGRMMLRATNTGITSIIGPDGKVLQQLPQHREAVLLGMAQGYAGTTPYVRWGNAAVLVLIALMLAGSWAAARR